jgi:hypothetical protein
MGKKKIIFALFSMGGFVHLWGQTGVARWNMYPTNRFLPNIPILAFG